MILPTTITILERILSWTNVVELMIIVRWRSSLSVKTMECETIIHTQSKNIFCFWNSPKLNYFYFDLFRSHCECDDLFFQCLKKSREDKAHAIGNVFFNVLGLQCAEPIYPKVCLSRESGSLDEVQRNAEVQGSNSNLPLEKRFLLNWFQTPQERHQPRCLKWVDDPDGPLQFRFRSPRRQF